MEASDDEDDEEDDDEDNDDDKDVNDDTPNEVTAGATLTVGDLIQAMKTKKKIPVSQPSSVVSDVFYWPVCNIRDLKQRWWRRRRRKRDSKITFAFSE